MKVINLFGGPGTGKSVLSAKLFTELKILGFKTELVQEYAKKMVYEERTNILTDQLYILAKQNRLFSVLEKNVDYAIADTSLLYSVIYTETSPIFKQLVLEIFNRYDNINILLERTVEYQTYGRIQDYEEAKKIDSSMKEMLDKYNIKYYTVDPKKPNVESDIIKIISNL